jgi:ribosomal protein L11 methyltransferase
LDYYLFRLLEGASLEEAQVELEKKGLKDLFVIEEDETGEIFIGGHSKKQIETTKALLVEKRKAEVNWNEQWSLFAENFAEGKAHIQLGEKQLLLTPGAGFGDLSHPTTYLMLEMMKERMKDEFIVDIGTGSGILALSALLLGAKSAVGIDIDAKALKHAKENAKLNGLKARFSKKLPSSLSNENILLMNMIFPEQKELKPKQLNRYAKRWIVSGILESQKEEYLAHVQEWNWILESEWMRLEWCGFIFKVGENESRPN